MESMILLFFTWGWDIPAIASCDRLPDGNLTRLLCVSLAVFLRSPLGGSQMMFVKPPPVFL